MTDGSTNFPIIDIANIDKQDSQVDIASEITAASRTWGFLLIKNHAIPAEAIEEMFNLSREFFVDTDENLKSPWPVNPSYIGYNRALTDKHLNDKSSMSVSY